MEIDDPAASSSHTLEEPEPTTLVSEDYVSYFTFASIVPPAYRKDSVEDELLLHPTLDYGSLQELPEPYKYNAEALNELLDLDLPGEPPVLLTGSLLAHHVPPMYQFLPQLPLQPPPRPASPACCTCGTSILDKHLFTIAGRKYHEECLRCATCLTVLANLKTCFERNEGFYCKGCYEQEFSSKCAGCDRSIAPSDWVRKARTNVYHIACFGCNQCKRQLSTGEEFAIQENKLLCKQHYVELVEGDSAASKQKTKRVRTTFTDEQINVLQTHFNIDSNPDGADLERIALQTGLSKRVTQVWFQNSRARQKKYNVKKPGTGHTRTDSMPSSSSDALSPHSEMSSEDCLFPHSATNMNETNMQQQQQHHRMEMMSMGLQTIDYD